VFVEVQDADVEDHRDATNVPIDLRSLVGEKKIALRARYKHQGIVYSRSSAHLGNSLIYFYPHGVKSEKVPGSIKYIVHKQGKILFAVQRHLDIPNDVVDPFKPYPYFPAKLYRSTLADLELVEIDWVLSHFARWQISQDHVVVLSLSKVKYFSNLWIVQLIQFLAGLAIFMYRYFL
jgi:hypothetical protein